MKLRTVSIGKVQTIQVGSDVMRTAHIKAAAPLPWWIGEHGVAGDERAAHHDAIYALGRASYDYWGNWLRIDPKKWPDGFFGENLTLDEMDERDLHVGDEFALGNQVRLVVAGARTPCVKLAWRLSQPRSFQKVFALSRQSGAYFGVLVGGEVQPGDELRRVHCAADLPTVPELCDWVASHSPPPLAPLKQLLAFEHLSPTIRLLLGAKLDAAERAAALVEGRWRGWRPFSIARIVAEAPDIASFYLHAEDGERLCQPRPGQFVAVRMTGRDGAPITRSWSLSAFAYVPDHYRLTVRRQGGAGSNWLHDAAVGARLQLRAPTGEFALDMGGFRPLVLVAAGIGITPLLAMVQAHLGRPAPAPVFLIYGARTPAELAFRAELDALAAAYDQLHIAYVYSRSDAGAVPATRITPRLATELLTGLYVVMQGQRIELPWYENDMYVCGPGNFCATLKAGLVDLGANPDHLFTELFASPDIAETDIESAEIRFTQAGGTTADVAMRWSADDDLTLLELAEQAGIAIASDCRAGACQTCRTRIVAGATTADTGDGHALPCIARPLTPTVHFLS